MRWIELRKYMFGREEPTGSRDSFVLHTCGVLTYACVCACVEGREVGDVKKGGVREVSRGFDWESCGVIAVRGVVQRQRFIEGSLRSNPHQQIGVGCFLTSITSAECNYFEY